MIVRRVNQRAQVWYCVSFFVRNKNIFLVGCLLKGTLQWVRNLLCEGVTGEGTCLDEKTILVNISYSSIEGKKHWEESCFNSYSLIWYHEDNQIRLHFHLILLPKTCTRTSKIFTSTQCIWIRRDASQRCWKTACSVVSWRKRNKRKTKQRELKKTKKKKLSLFVANCGEKSSGARSWVTEKFRICFSLISCVIGLKKPLKIAPHKNWFSLAENSRVTSPVTRLLPQRAQYSTGLSLLSLGFSWTERHYC